jgi:L-alanine-DL-glutamate epimerase-like enolase superfamily enzyme
MANDHAALAGGGTVAEWPIKPYALREAMLAEPWRIERGQLLLSDTPGLGVRLTPEIEREFPFREDAVYRCLVDPSKAPAADWR